jgi:Right handed beta helix region
MYTSAELQLLRNADPGVKIPGIDTPVGNPLSASSLKSLSSLPTNSTAPVFYQPQYNRVVISRAGTVVSGYNFDDATVYVNANNVTIKDSTFTGTTGNYAVQVSGATNTTVTDDTFNGGGADLPLVAWVTSGGHVTITDNRFIDTPSDAIHLMGSGVISGNDFSGAGYTSNAQHPDAIWVPVDNGPVSITDNFIDSTMNPNSDVGANDCIRITTEQGNTSNVKVSGNLLIGGAASIDAGNGGSGRFSNISITNNYLGFATYNGFYPGPMKGVTLSSNVDFDYTNPVYAAKAWVAYRAAGLPTKNLLVSTNGSTVKAGALTGSTTLYGSAGAHLYGGASENDIVAGYGREYLTGGAGANVFTYLTPTGLTTQTKASESFISGFDPAKDVIDLSHIDANLTSPGLQSFTFIGTKAFTSAGAEVRYQLNRTAGATIIQATLAGDTSPDLTIQIAGLLNLTSANFALTSAQSKTDLAKAAALSDSSSRSGSATEYIYTNVPGRSYSSYAAIAYANNTAADDLYLSASSNEIELFENGATITRGGQSERFAIGNGSFNLPYHANETIQAAGVGAETFAFSQGFGRETIDGFAPSGAKADTLKLSESAFSYLNAGMTQAQDLAAVLNHASRGANTTIADSHGDSLTLVGVTAATLAANPGAVKFV